MAAQPLHFRWRWRLTSSPQALWPLLADTNRFDRDAGMPPVQVLAAETGPDANTRRWVRQKRMGMTVEWLEEPTEWVYPLHFAVRRRFRKGPIAQLEVRVELHAQAVGGTEVDYQLSVLPANFLLRPFIALSIGPTYGKKFERIAHRYDRLAQAGRDPDDEPTQAVRLSHNAEDRLVQARPKLLAGGASPDVADKLIDFIRKADDFALAGLRPYVLADRWGLPRRQVLEGCLVAVRAGLLDLRWELLCPSCRGPRQVGGSLRDIRAKAHCEVCQIDFNADFDQSVELLFTPNPAIRRLEVAKFCVGGPQVTPHIVAQQLLPAGQSRRVDPRLDPGSHRLRTIGGQGVRQVVVEPVGQATAAIDLTAEPLQGQPLSLAPRCHIEFNNRSTAEKLVLLERTAWSDQAATAAQVTALQVFRDLFANEALRPGEQFAVGNLTVLSTDLRESTRLYRQIGDAPAFGRVMDHFDVLRQAIAAEQGALVKTMGDSVMAVFHEPVGALRAVLAAQAKIDADPETSPRLQLKAGLHSGACIAVTLNDRLDYFGSTVNAAARLGALAAGGDLVVSAAVRNDPAVAAYLAGTDCPVTAEPFQAVLRGFDHEKFELFRLCRRPIKLT